MIKQKKRSTQKKSARCRNLTPVSIFCSKVTLKNHFFCMRKMQINIPLRVLLMRLFFGLVTQPCKNATRENLYHNSSLLNKRQGDSLLTESRCRFITKSFCHPDLRKVHHFVLGRTIKCHKCSGANIDLFFQFFFSLFSEVIDQK